MNLRRQLSLFAPPSPVASAIDAVRALIDPVQHRLIPAHVTLCRDDELDDVDAIRARLGGLVFAPVTLRFGVAEPFSSHGWLLPCVDGEAAFRALRGVVLGSEPIREQAPHLTLAHPRNEKAIGNTPANATQLPAPLVLTFATIALIEQDDATTPWRVVERYGATPHPLSL